MLPPKDRTSVDSNQPSIRQLLGRSPDRADSLVLAVWILKNPAWNGTIEGYLVCSGNPGDSIPLSDEELKDADPFIRDLVLTSREMAKERQEWEANERDWDDHYWGYG